MACGVRIADGGNVEAARGRVARLGWSHHLNGAAILPRSWRIDMPKKQSSPKTSTLAGKVLAGKKPTPKEARRLAGSVLSQDEKKGQGRKKR